MPAKPGELAITGTIRGIKPTESELKIIFALIENLLAPIEADWEAAAKSAGLKDRKSFRDMYRRLRLKYGLPDGTKVTATAAGAAGAADGGSGAAEGDAAAETPIKKTASSRKKKPAADEGDSGLLLTPTTSMSTPGHTGLTGVTNSFTMGNDFIEYEQPDTPSKSTTTTVGKKRNTAEAGNPDETPAKKKPVRKPRMTAKQKREAAAAAAAEQAIAAAEEDQKITVATSFEPVSSSMFAACDTTGDAAGIDTTMEGMEEPGSEAAEALALALEVNAAAEAEEAAAVDGRADAVASPTEI